MVTTENGLVSGDGDIGVDLFIGRLLILLHEKKLKWRMTMMGMEYWMRKPTWTRHLQLFRNEWIIYHSEREEFVQVQVIVIAVIQIEHLTDI